MPRFEPFPGVRFDPKRVRADDVIAPPYDVITPAERNRLAARHRANAVLVELPEPDLVAGENRYQVAARLFGEWTREELLRRDPRPALYPYRMTVPDGQSTTGIIGALGLEEPGDDAGILPHEETLPKAKSDRLDLLTATHANLSPVWGLSLTAGLTETFDPSGSPLADAFDDDGVRHQLWKLDDLDTVLAVGEAVGASDVVIADGHHRYETALAYRRRRRAANGDQPGGYDLVMALLVELSDSQLSVGAIHRTLSGLLPGVDLSMALERWFDVIRAGPADERTVDALSEADGIALVTRHDAYLLLPRDEAFEAVGSNLDSALVAAALAELAPHDVDHRHSEREAVSAVQSGEADAALLLRPITVTQIAQWARERRRMPPKTTYFRPKPRTGMVFRTLD